MIKINKTDSLIDILSKIKNSKDFNVILDFPFWHPILHNYLWLKIIKSKVWTKTLIIITNDLSSKKIWKSLWIKYSIVKDEKFIEKETLLKHNFTFFEYLKFEVNKYKKYLKKIIFKNKKTTEVKSIKEKHTTWISFFLLWLFLSSLMLVFIFYFAVNKSYIYITPEITVKTRWKNIIFREKQQDSIMEEDNVIWVQKVSKSVNLEEKFQTTWIKEDSINKASWEVIFFNKTSESQDLVVKTRLQTSDWILYEIDNSISIPSATTSTNWDLIPWELKTKIYAKIYDINWIFIWEKWNIWTWITLQIPWLEKELNSQVYAVTDTDIKWWWNKQTKFLSKNDLISSEKILESKLRDNALKEIKNEIKNKNKDNNVVFELLDIKDGIKYWNPEIKRIWNLNIGDKIESFTLSWNIKVEAYIYNKESLINKMSWIINESILSDVEKISAINDKSLRISNLIYKIDDPFEVKATVEIDVFVLHVFSKDWDDYYLEKLKNSILWLDKEEAEKILLNDKQISDVKIDIKPFFIKNLPNFPNNIIFKVEE